MERILIVCDFKSEQRQKLTYSILSHIIDSMKESDVEIHALCIIDEKERIREQINALIGYALQKIYILEGSEYKNEEVEAFLYGLHKVINYIRPKIVLFNHLPFHKTVSAMLAIQLNVGIVANCIDFKYSLDKKFIMIRPTFDGDKLANIASTSEICLATVMPLQNIPFIKNNHDVEIIELKSDNDFKKQPLIRFILDNTKQGHQDNNQNIVFAGGFGLGSKQNFMKLKQLAEKYNAGLAASRVAVDLGWADPELLIGMSGYSICPKIYVAFGISGALQHLEGIKNAGTIISINTNRNAIIHTVCDYFLVHDAIDIIERLMYAHD